MNEIDFPAPNRRYTIEEYLTLERQSEERHEFFDGIVRTIESANDKHATLHVNLLALLGIQLKSSPFRPFGKGFLIYCGEAPRDYFSFPDLSVFDGRPYLTTNTVMFFSIRKSSSKSYHPPAKPLIVAKSLFAIGLILKHCKITSLSRKTNRLLNGTHDRKMACG